eukprot:CAMPEP_0182515068 /NCGR_PEP_ID=MMETSP1321-20130603/37310_1 /TAXON_ID=91990 /ORGANISM="Bolidomonas sp., Strain RCC1657" /LENGTH=347 /DNA_ID=CAMNT_0024722417 /DNA_START=41 /DNA_END=1080 /DNA_ORIENTATION=-
MASFDLTEKPSAAFPLPEPIVSSLTALLPLAPPIEHPAWLDAVPEDLQSQYQTYTTILTDLNSLTSKYALLTTSLTKTPLPTGPFPSTGIDVLNRIIKVMSDLKTSTESLRTTGNALLLNDELQNTFLTVVKSFGGITNSNNQSQPNYGTSIAGKVFYAVKPWLYSDSVTFSDLNPTPRKSSRFSNVLFLKRLVFNYLKRLQGVLTAPQRVVEDDTYYRITGDDDFWDYVYSNDSGNEEYDSIKGAFCETDYEVVKSVNSVLKKVGDKVKTYLNQPSKDSEDLVINVDAISARVEESLSPETLDVDEDGDLIKNLVELKNAVEALTESLGGKGELELGDVETAMSKG